jgi:protoporphyrinogen oxidase
MSRNSAKILVLGAGCAGLSAAWRLARKGFKVEVFEAAPKVGGIAAGTIINGNIFECGPHVFHAADPEIMQDIKSIAQDSLLPFHRTIKIKFLGNYFNFPLSIADIFTKLPLSTLCSAITSFFFHSVKGLLVKPKQENSETVLIRCYGKVLYTIFFKSYIKHVWGIEPAEFSPEFARQRIPKLDVLNILEVLRSHLKLNKPKNKNVDVSKFVEKVEGELYTTKKGFSGITDKIAEEILRLGGTIQLNSKVKQIVWDKETGVKQILYQKNGEDYLEEARAVISTLPINEMIHMLRPTPEPSVMQAADKLKFRALVFVGIVVGRTKILPSSFMYFRDLTFNRITDLEYFGLDIFPKHGTILVAEISCNRDDVYWHDEKLAQEAVLRDLEREQLLKREEVLECYTYRLAHAYPMYTLGYEEQLHAILDFVKMMGNFKTIGRQGGFQYANAHMVIRAGYNAAEEVVDRLSQQ